MDIIVTAIISRMSQRPLDRTQLFFLNSSTMFDRNIYSETWCGGAAFSHPCPAFNLVSRLNLNHLKSGSIIRRWSVLMPEARRLMLQRLPAAEMLMHYLDLHSYDASIPPSSELAEVVLDEFLEQISEFFFCDCSISWPMASSWCSITNQLEIQWRGHEIRSKRAVRGFLDVFKICLDWVMTELCHMSMFQGLASSWWDSPWRAAALNLRRNGLAVR